MDALRMVDRRQLPKGVTKCLAFKPFARPEHLAVDQRAEIDNALPVPEPAPAPCRAAVIAARLFPIVSDSAAIDDN
jgi:hypothetical protein